MEEDLDHLVKSSTDLGLVVCFWTNPGQGAQQAVGHVGET